MGRTLPTIGSQLPSRSCRSLWRGERPFDFCEEIGRIARLDQDAIEARRARFGKLTFVRKPGRRDEGNVTQAGRAADLPRRLTPGHTGELEIQDDDVWTG